ncbi:MAG: anthranilate phosphoribosyltransferase [Elusimicrobia bacterium RIFOXYA2_FULL_39_19]|nr:MAG: anthranilate phosphoribosyltransferase [Elusimicrobia bacterium RIFOXYA2_FULL_39_19]
MIKEAIGKAVTVKNLTEKEAMDTMTEIMSGQATESQIAAFITAMRMKGETIEEITGCAKIMRQFATPFESKAPKGEKIIDTCGTGGDSSKTFNVSTLSAFVCAGAGAYVVKHGNRAVTSSCGSADLFEALGVKLELNKEQAEKCLADVGIVFLFAPAWHSAMKYAMPVRKQIAIRTIFNILGPLSNPANPAGQVLGVYSLDLIEPLAYVLKNIGLKQAFVVHSRDGLDEISVSDETKICELTNNKIKQYTIRPEDFGMERSKLEDLTGGDTACNKQILLDILSGQVGPKRDFVLINAAAALVCAGKAKNINDGIKLAEKSIDSGNALKKVELLKDFTSKLQ